MSVSMLTFVERRTNPRTGKDVFQIRRVFTVVEPTEWLLTTEHNLRLEDDTVRLFLALVVAVPLEVLDGPRISLGEVV
jgi:hypothetical protein